jgi:hypothetical protein
VQKALTSQLLVSCVHVAAGRTRKNGWVKFYKQTLNITQGPIPALMGTFMPYSSAKAWAKFEKFVLSGISYMMPSFLWHLLRSSQIMRTSCRPGN